MSNKQQEQYPQDDSYPDLDLDDDNKQGDQDIIKKKIKTQSSHEEGEKSINKFPLPLFMAGKISFPPPPPSSVRPTQQTYQKPNYVHKIQQSSNNLKYAQANHNKQRKNCVFIKNIPKCYNQNQKLTTFFRNYGMIKQIKTNQDNYQAIVRFKRQQDTLKFINSDTKVFNRSYIICTTDQNEKVPENLVKQRENDQLGTARRPFQMQVKFMKDKIQTSFIYKYRTLLFIKNNLLNQQQRSQIDKQLQECKKGKSDLQKLTDQELKKQSSVSNDYDWTISFVRKQQAEPNKKELIKQFTAKYGPIGSVTIQLKTNQADKQKQQIEKPWMIQIHFLSPKSAWKMYLHGTENTDQEIKGNSIKTIFTSGKLKLPENTSQKSNLQNVTVKQDKILEQGKEEPSKNESHPEEKQNEVLEAKEVNK